jgi:prolycopene isomerase
VGLDCDPGVVGITETTNFLWHYTDMNKVFSGFRKLDIEDDYVLLSCYTVSDPIAPLLNLSNRYR